MLKRIDYKHQTQSIPLTKGQSTYNKLQRKINMIENNENSIEKTVRPFNQKKLS